MKKKRLIWVIALALSFNIMTGCEEKLTNEELPPFDPRIVVNGVLSNDSTIHMEISSSGSPYSVAVRPEILSDAEVSMKVNDVNAALTYNSASGRYESQKFIKAGDQVYISVSHPRTLSAASTVYLPPNLSFFKTTLVPNGGKDINDLTSDRLDIQFQDDPAVKNYYNVRFFYYNETSQEYLPFDFPVTDPTLLANSTFKLDDGTYVIKDDLFHGQIKTISIVPPFGYVIGNTDIKYLVQVISLSADYWNYLESLNRYHDNESSSGLFNDGVVVHSNISGGLGILGTQLVESDTIR